MWTAVLVRPGEDVFMGDIDIIGADVPPDAGGRSVAQNRADQLNKEGHKPRVKGLGKSRGKVSASWHYGFWVVRWVEVVENEFGPVSP